MLGYCCLNMNLRNMTTPVYTGRTCQQSRFSPDLAGKLALANVQDLLRILHWNERSGVKCFRISSHMFPHATNPAVMYQPSDLPTGSEIRRTLAECGRFAQEHGHTLSMHPPHFVSLASDDQGVQRRSREELEHHDWIADAINCGGPELRINLNWHFGRGYGLEHIPVFVNNWRKLPGSVRWRACIENDDKANCWSVNRLRRDLWPHIGCRLSFDFHHWQFCQEFGREAEFRLAQATWAPGERMECHMSSSADVWPRSVTHSYLVYDDIPEYAMGEDCYVMIEAGGKEIALFDYCSKHDIILNRSIK